MLKRPLSGIALKKRPKKILVKYVTSERVERADVAGLATTKKGSCEGLGRLLGRYLMAAGFFYRMMSDMEIIKYNGVTYNAGQQSV